MVLEMLFLTLSNADVQFTNCKWHWKLYIAAKALPTTHYKELINQKEFANATLDKNEKAFVIHVASLSDSNKCLKMLIYLSHRVQLASFITNKALIAIFFEYFDYADLFLPEFAAKLSNNIGIYNHHIDLIEDQ